jgi:hypothetical protein
MNRRSFLALAFCAAAFRRKREISPRNEPIWGTLTGGDYQDWLNEHKALVSLPSQQNPPTEAELDLYQIPGAHRLQELLDHPAPYLNPPGRRSIREFPPLDLGRMRY